MKLVVIDNCDNSVGHNCFDDNILYKSQSIFMYYNKL